MYYITVSSLSGPTGYIVPRLFLLDISLVIFIYKYYFWSLRINTDNFGLLSFCQLKLLLPLFGSYWAFFGPTGTRNSFGDLKMMSNGPTHLYRQLSFSESAPIHAYKSISKACWGQTDRPTDRRTDRQTDQASYRSDFSSLKNVTIKWALSNITSNFNV